MKNHFPPLLLALLLLPLLNSQAQSRRFPLGCEFDAALYRQSTKGVPANRSIQALPRQSSLKAHCPYAGKQAFMDCTAWACAYSAFSILDARQRGWTNRQLITDFSYSVSHVFNQLRKSEDCNSFGISIESALELMKESGCFRHKEFGYHCEAEPRARNVRQGPLYQIDDYFSLADHATGRVSTAAIKEALANQQPVIIAIDAYDSFSEACMGQAFWSGQLDYKRGIHALTIVGYDDASQSFELMNSWGRDWGTEGFIRLKYSDLQNILLAAYILYKEAPLDLQPTNVTQPLRGQIEFEHPQGQSISLQLQNQGVRFVHPLSSGESFRLTAQLDRPAYIYLLGSDNESQDRLLLPSHPTHNAFVPFEKSRILFPGADQWISLDHTEGVDYLCILLSEEALDPTELMERLGQLEGSFSRRMQAVLGTSAIPGSTSDCQLAADHSSLSIKASQSTQKLVSVVVEIQHELD